MTYSRPDEIASDSRIKRSQERDENLKKGIQTTFSLGTAAIGAGLASKVTPFLSEYIPVELAMKGINKVSPKLGSFLQRGAEQGLSIKEGLNFIKENLAPSQKTEEIKPDQRNIVQQYSDELHQFIDKYIKKGKNTLEAVALAQLEPKYDKVMRKIEADHKTPFSNIAQSIYGTVEKPSKQTESGEPEGMGRIDNMLNSITQNAPANATVQPQNPPVNQQAASPAVQKLTEILQAIQQTRR